MQGDVGIKLSVSKQREVSVPSSFFFFFLLILKGAAVAVGSNAVMGIMTDSFAVMMRVGVVRMMRKYVV